MSSCLDRIQSVIRWLDAHNGLVNGLATIVIAVLTGVLVTINRHQVEDARVVQRAFISVTPMADSSSTQSSSYFGAIFENQGATPTRNFRYAIDSTISYAELADNYVFADDEMKLKRSFLGPKEKLLSRHVPEGAGVTREDVADIIAGKKHLYVFGLLRYFDAFDGSREHIGKFCYEVRLSSGPDVNFLNGNFFPSMCPSHNCADDDCSVR